MIDKKKKHKTLTTEILIENRRGAEGTLKVEKVS